tara:strand:- start:223 stop:669 length:447 start_codon:yes stop_codon:yes gene_type:complete
MTESFVNLVKLCVGARTISDLAKWQEQKCKLEATDNGTGKIAHVTRMRPKREKDLISGGSIYWVFKGFIMARQRILTLEEYSSKDGIKRCALILGDEIFKTEPKPKRAFQGWRYLSPSDAPKDIGKFNITEDQLPHNLQVELVKLGVL